MKKKWIGIAFLFVSFLFATNVYADEQLYTAYNIWYEKPTALWSINYKRGTIIPAGTKIKSVSVKRNRVTFTTDDSAIKFVINFTGKYHPGIDINEFKDRVFTTKTLKELTRGFTKNELECVEGGVLKTGIRKKAVLVTYGYPPEHATISTDNNTWLYWMNRFKKKAIYFDSSGRTTKKLIKPSETL